MLSARAGDILGMRRMFVVGLALFTAAWLIATRVASGLVNVAHQLGGSLGLGILVAVFAAAGSNTLASHALLAHRVSASFTVGTIMLALALLIVLALIVRSNKTA